MQLIGELPLVVRTDMKSGDSRRLENTKSLTNEKLLKDSMTFASGLVFLVQNSDCQEIAFGGKTLLGGNSKIIIIICLWVFDTSNK